MKDVLMVNQKEQKSKLAAWKKDFGIKSKVEMACGTCKTLEETEKLIKK